MKADWEIKPLPEIAEYFIGLTYKPEDVGNLGTIVLRSSNVQNDALDLSDLVRVNRSVKKSLYVRKGDILMCSRNGSKRLVGKTAVIGDLPEEMTFGTFMTVVRSNCSPYLSWFFRSELFRDQIGVGENTMINQITKYMLDAIRVPLPPLAEQQRIVAILDEAFDGIATAKVNAEKNLQNARALFESHLQSVFSQRGEGWTQRPLGELCELISGQHIDAADYNTESRGIGYLTGPSDFGEMHPVVTKWTEFPKRMARAGDILITVKGSGVGKINLMKFPELAISRQLMAIRATAAEIEYLRAFLTTKFDYFQSLANGAAIPGISRGDVLHLLCPMPPPKKMHEVITLIRCMADKTQRLESIYKQKLIALDELKKSLLHQAFSGAL
ncbi:MAG: restriction endonuclease subunit S [Polaromonas sp.]|uniref:restriction endonuclease subunit S n=1 Tax=Polaromonas sp. TaxID=1869339 RepID=UPI0024888B87|nr:restriction endonuclease subunit S [Polaromonas sp.]MDI1237034.1 restriction endonuclease subunit S [Polaromonas sp.]